MSSLAGLARAAPDLSTQLVLVVLHAVFWHVFVEWSWKGVVLRYVNTKPWKQRWVDLNRKMFTKNFGIPIESDDIAVEFACKYAAVLFQHLIGGVMTLPAVLGLQSSAVAPLACHGALCEGGWELQDMVTRLWKTFLGDEDSKRKNPKSILAITCLHHAMGLSMTIPMNILYHDNAYYHEFVFLLQCASALALSLQSFGFTLDVKTADGLRWMKFSVLATWLSIFWSRGVRYLVVGVELLRQSARDSNMRMFYIGVVVLTSMGVMNGIFFVDATAKLRKFLPMKHVPVAEAPGVDSTPSSEALPCLMGQEGTASKLLTAKADSKQKIA